MISQSDSGSENATTRSGVSAGTINITNPTGQTQDLANLNRDTSNLNGTVSKTPDVQNLLDKQADTMNAAQAAGQVVAQGIGSYADMKQKEAQHAADAAKLAGDTTAQAAYQAEADSWGEGGTNRLYLHIAGGALIGGLGGGGIGSAAQGAAGAGLAALLADQTAQAAKEVAGATDSTLAGKVSGNLLIGALGGLVGGAAGAATASNVNLYNQWNHTDTDTLEEASGQGTVRKKTTALDLVLQGIANGLNAVIGAGGGKPPAASPGVVLAGEAGGGQLVQAGVTGHVPDNATFANGGKNDRLPIPEKVTADNGLEVKSNPKHTPGMEGNWSNAGTEPRNSLDLFNSSIPGGDRVRYAIDSKGNINRFFADGNGVYHWSGATGDSYSPLNVSKIPIGVKRALGFKGK
jgi:filamentous hemagglutinin